MKFLCSILFACIMLLLSVHAGSFEVKVAFGFNNVSNLKIPDANSIDSPTGNSSFMRDEYVKKPLAFAFGIGYEVKMSEYMSFVPEVIYIQKPLSYQFSRDYSYVWYHDYIYETVDRHETYDFELSLNYLEIPVGFRHYFKPMYVSTGASIAFLLSNTYASKYTIYDSTGDYFLKNIDERSIDGNLNSTVFSLYGAIGYEILSQIKIEFRYVYALSPLEKHAKLKEIPSLLKNTKEWNYNHPFRTMQSDSVDSGKNNSLLFLVSMSL